MLDITVKRAEKVVSGTIQTGGKEIVRTLVSTGKAKKLDYLNQRKPQPFHRDTIALVLWGGSPLQEEPSKSTTEYGVRRFQGVEIIEESDA